LRRKADFYVEKVHLVLCHISGLHFMTITAQPATIAAVYQGASRSMGYRGPPASSRLHRAPQVILVVGFLWLHESKTKKKFACNVIFVTYLVLSVIVYGVGLRMLDI
jgi:hypothetical protein